jgi:DNA repair photolyase
MGLNKSKGNMYEWITHTWNTVKGACYHDCSYCHPAGTMILMADFTQKPIERIAIGDHIIGITKENQKGFYRLKRTVVTNLSTRESNVLEFVTDDGYLQCTPEHPLMGSTPIRNCTDWKEAKSFSPYENLRYISKHSRGVYSDELRMGYLKGIRDGDGCVFSFKNKEGREYKGFEIVCVDEQLRNRIKSEFKAMLNIDLLQGVKRSSHKSYGQDSIMLHTRKTKEVVLLEEETAFRLNREFAKGYIAGMIDTDGSIGKNKVIRISQSKTVNLEKYNRIIKCVDLLNLKYVEEKDIIRINSSFGVRVDILLNYGVFHSQKSERLMLGSTIKGSKHSQIKSISAVGEKVVYNLQTESENFIANGFIVHNCYMKGWGELNPVRFDEKELLTDLGKGNFIFVGSSCDMWAQDIPLEWILNTLEWCHMHDLNQYLFQTKNPARITGMAHQHFFPANSVVCSTIETNRFYKDIMRNSPPTDIRANELEEINHLGIDTYVTIEPIMDFDLKELVELMSLSQAKQVNIGADSKGHKLPEPPKEKILELITELEKFTVVKQKDNLKRLLR